LILYLAPISTRAFNFINEKYHLNFDTVECLFDHREELAGVCLETVCNLETGRRFDKDGIGLSDEADRALRHAK